MSKFQKVCLVRVIHEESASARIYESYPFVIGRSPEVAVGILDPGVSRAHLEVNLKHERLFIKDMGSANGSFHNGAKLEKNIAVLFTPGDTLELGTNHVPVMIDIFEKSFEVRQLAKGTKEEQQEGNTLLDAAKAEVERQATLFKAQLEQAESATQLKTLETIEAARVEAERIVAQAHQQAEAAVRVGQEQHDQVVAAAENHATEAAQDVYRRAEQHLADSKIQAQIQAQSLLAKAEVDSQSQRATLLAEGRVELKNLRDSDEAEVAAYEQKVRADIEAIRKNAALAAEEVLASAEKRAEAQMRLAEAQGQDEVAKLLMAADMEIRARTDKNNSELAALKADGEALHAEAKRLHSITDEAYQVEVKRGEAEVEEYRRKVEEEISVRAEQSQILLKNAVEKSTKMMDDAEKKSTTMLKSAELKSEAQLTVSRRESENLMEKTQQDILQQFSDAQAEMKQLRIDTETSLRDLTLQKALLKEEIDEMDGHVLEAKNEIENQKSRAAELRQTIEVLSKEETKLIAVQSELNLATAELSKTQLTRAQIALDIETRQKDWEQTQKRSELELQAERDKARAELAEYKEREQTALAHLKHEELKQMQEVRQEEDQDLSRHRSKIVKELLSATEIHFVNALKTDLPKDFDWSKVLEPLQNQLKNNLEEKVYQISNQSADEPSKTMNKSQLVFRAKAKKVGYVSAGLMTLLMAIPFTRNGIFDALGGNSMGSAAEHYTKDMQTERERRYLPEKTRSWKDNYTDAVIYTEGYVEMKLNPEQQDKWIKDLHEYLYTKLRVEEDSIVKLVSLEAALVTNLKEQADQIHPDFIKEKLERMRTIEDDAVIQMRKIIGTEAKYEKFQKFSRDYYYNEYLLRLPAGEGELRVLPTPTEKSNVLDPAALRTKKK